MEEPQPKRAKTSPPPSDESSSTVVVQLLCTNDTHSKMAPVRWEGGAGAAKGVEVGGLVRRARALRQLARRVPATLVLDVGDHFTGSPFFTFLRGAAEVDALDRLGYHATALGNHDFDSSDGDGQVGLERLRALVRERAPRLRVLCSNVVVEEEEKEEEEEEEEEEDSVIHSDDEADDY